MAQQKLRFADESSLFARAGEVFGAESGDLSSGDDSELSSSEDDFSSDGDLSSEDEDVSRRGASERVRRKMDESSGSEESGDTDDEVAEGRRRLVERVVLAEAKSRARHRRKNRVLVLSSTGVGARYRHLMNDVAALLPHCKRDAKVDVKKNLHELNELADVNSCEKCLFFQMKSKRDMFLWAARCPTGPSVLFQVVNVHTMSELKLTGNSLRGSRPVLLFDAAFDNAEMPHLGMIKELFQEIWATPEGHPKSKPFIDHIMCFFWQDEHIWFRNYQIVQNADGTKKGAKNVEATTQMAEIGPRFVLEPIRIFSQSFGGPTVWKNTDYVTPAKVRQAERKLSSGSYANRVVGQQRAQEKYSKLSEGLPEDEFANTFRR
jgi:ribosome biogenesis protein BRX1